MLLTLYEHQDGQNKGLQREHFSVVYDQDGFTRMDK